MQQKRNAVYDDLIFIAIIILMRKITVIQNEADQYGSITILNMYVFFSMIKWYQLLRKTKHKARKPIQRKPLSTNPIITSHPIQQHNSEPKIESLIIHNNTLYLKSKYQIQEKRNQKRRLNTF